MQNYFNTAVEHKVSTTHNLWSKTKTENLYILLRSIYVMYIVRTSYLPASLWLFFRSWIIFLSKLSLITPDSIQTDFPNYDRVSLFDMYMNRKGNNAAMLSILLAEFHIFHGSHISYSVNYLIAISMSSIWIEKFPVVFW